MKKFNRSFGKGQTVADWCREFYAIAGESERLYRLEDGGLLHLPLQGGPQRIYDAESFYGLAHFLVDVRQFFRGEGEDGWYDRAALLTKPQVQSLFDFAPNSDLPAVKTVIMDPVVLPAPAGPWSVTRPGYNPQGGHNHYYYVGVGQEAIEPRPGVDHLRQCFAGVPFEKEGYRNNLLAWLLGAVVLDPQMDTPFLVVSGNQQGIGKSVCVQAAGHILQGRLPPPIDFRGAEFMKSVSTRFRENERVVFLDNIVTRHAESYDNSQLSTLLTQGFSKKIRILGQSKAVSASGILFVASINEAKLSADLTTRTLPVKLFKTENSPMVPFCLDYAIQHRREIYGELLNLAMLPTPGPATSGDHRAFRFRRWLDFVQPRIESVFGPLAIEEVSSLDDTTQEIFHSGADLLDSGVTEFSAKDLLNVIASSASKYPSLFNNFIERVPSERGRKIKLGHFLSSHRDHVHKIGDVYLRLVRAKETSAKEGAAFSFEIVSQEVQS